MNARVPSHPRYVIHQRAMRTAAAGGWPQGMVMRGFRGLGQDSGCDPSDPLCDFYGGSDTTPTTGTDTGITTCTAATPIDCPAGSAWVYSPSPFPSTLPTTSNTTGTSPAAAPGGATFGGVNWTAIVNNAIASMSRIGQIMTVPAGSTISPTGAITLGNPTLNQLTASISGYLPLILLGGGALLLFSAMSKK